MLDGEIKLSKEVENKLESIDKTLKKILKWIQFENIQKLKKVLEDELDIDEKKIAYEDSDGVNGLKEIEELSGAPQKTIHNWWQK